MFINIAPHNNFDLTCGLFVSKKKNNIKMSFYNHP